MEEFDRVIIIAFDGLDRKKIQDFGLENVKQQEFGKLDLEGMELHTGKLWASFITGVGPEEHGIERTMNWTNQRINRFENRVKDSRFFEFWKGVRWTVFRNWDRLNAEVLGAYRENLEVETTIFEDFTPSISLNVPGYDKNTALTSIRIGNALGKDAPLSKDLMERDIDAEFMKRKEELFKALEEDFALLMAHFHKPDFMQHLYGFDMEKQEETYREMEELAERIKQEAGENDLIIFCSDHGLEDGGHRDEAFYSLSHDLGLENPGITDFRPILNQLEVRKKLKETGIEV